MRSAEFDQPATKQTLDLYVQNAVEDIERVKNLTSLCLAEAERPDVKPYVDALARLRCVDTITALAFIASMGDFERFGNGRSVSSYFGLTPKRSDSGEKTGRNGKITKAGDSLVRLLLVEGVCGIGSAKTIRHLAKWKREQADILSRISVEQGDLTPVCCNGFGNLYDYNMFWRQFKEFKEEAGFPDLVLHELRHTQASLLLGNGVDVKTVQKRLGHARASITLDTYAHAIPENDKKAAELVGDLCTVKRGRIIKVKTA